MGQIKVEKNAGGRNNGRLKDKKKAEPIISVLENRFRHSS